jgi:ubiquinone biosynthesis protein
MGIRRTFGNIRRFREISFILAKYGFGFVTKNIKFSKTKPSTTPEQFRKLLEELGPTFVKFGQLLSTQENILPYEFIEELKKLQDDVTPFEFNKVKSIIEAEFKKPLNEIFSYFNENVEASASLGQVHKAVLISGQTVAIKVKRPNIEKIIQADIELLKQIGDYLNSKLKLYFNFEIKPFIREFEETIKKELDYEIEAQYMQTFKENLNKFKNIYVPKVFWEYTSHNVLTMEFIDGYKATNIESIRSAGFDTEKLATEGAKVFWTQIFDIGLFHADPHPGNIIIMKDGRICYLDYGMVGRVTQEDKLNLVEMILGFIQKDADKILLSVSNFTLNTNILNNAYFKSDIVELIDIYHSLPLKRIYMSKVLRDLFRILKKYNIIISKNSLRLLRAIIIADGVGRQFYPDFNFTEIAKPYFEGFAKKLYSPFRIFKKILQPNATYAILANKIPFLFKKAEDLLESGHVKVEIEINGLDRLINTIRLVAKQIGISLIISSVILGSSILIKDHLGKTFLGLPIKLVIPIVIIIILGIGIYKADKELK